MYIKIEIIPDSKKEVIKKTGEDSFEIRVKEPALNNLANKRLLDIMRNIYPKKRIKIISGHRSRKKILSIE